MGASQMTQYLQPGLTTYVQSSDPVWWEENDSYNLPSDLTEAITVHTPAPTHEYFGFYL